MDSTKSISPPIYKGTASILKVTFKLLRVFFEISRESRPERTSKYFFHFLRRKLPKGTDGVLQNSRRKLHLILLILALAWAQENIQAQSITNTAALYVSPGTTLFTGGNFTNNAGATTEGQGIIELDGNWVNNGTFTPGTGSVIFSGASPQSITKSPLENYYQLTINNTSTGVTLNDDVQVTNALTLTDGILTTSTANLLTLTNGATSTAGSAACFVDGPMKKIGSQAFVFPLGDNTFWARLGITAPTSATTEYTAQYFDATHPDLTVISPLVNVSAIEYWTLDQAVNNDDVQVSLYWEDSIRSIINNCISADLGVARYNGTDWVDEGRTAITCNTAGNLTSNTVANYSPFTFSSKSTSSNPLPIELQYFDAILLNNQTVSVEWTTVVELNNDFFTVERSATGVDFKALASIPGAGNSNGLLNYNLPDLTPLTGVSYYRLKQTDYDGSYTYSQTVAVNLEGINLINIYPVPAVDNMMAIVLSAFETGISFQILDLTGRKVVNVDFVVQEGLNEISLDVSSLASGNYMLSLTTDSGMYKAIKALVVTADN
ncbi:MAG: T9SS type A sorting domain-containing protein [Flavobacteriales bacterium]|nr:T9SS type A sorting domain-containing protein [Flavobacteriales bacterium]